MKLIEKPLETQGIFHGEIEGSLLSGFILHDVDYQGQVKAKSVAVKVDLKQLKKRVLYIDNLVLNELQIEEDFLTSLIDENSTNEDNHEQNSTLPFVSYSRYF